MSSSRSIFRTPVPTEPRYKVSRPCSLHAGAIDHPGEVINVSYGGLRIVLRDMVPLGELQATHWVSVDDLGRIDVRIRWRKGRTLGCAFRDPNRVRPALPGFLSKHAAEHS